MVDDETCDADVCFFCCERAKVAGEKKSLIRKAEAYVAASNEHDLGQISTMLAPDCCYRSAGVGVHDGVEAIMTMMGVFFTSNPDVRWQAENYRWHSDCVKFDSLISLGANTSSGVEEIHFNDAEKICRIVVER